MNCVKAVLPFLCVLVSGCGGGKTAGVPNDEIIENHRSSLKDYVGIEVKTLTDEQVAADPSRSTDMKQVNVAEVVGTMLGRDIGYVTIEKAPYIRGKAIAVAADKPAQISDFSFELPAELCATTPEQVQTIIWVRENKRKVGQYTETGAKAWVHEMAIVLIDRKEHRVIGTQRFGSKKRPPKKHAGRADWVGDPTRPQAVEYLRGLPRK